MIEGLPTKLKDLREQYHYSQKEVANRLNISPSIVSGYETGERTPSTEILLKISSLYQCSTDYLLGRVTTTPTTITLDTEGLNQEQIQALQTLIQVMKQK